MADNNVTVITTPPLVRVDAISPIDNIKINVNPSSGNVVQVQGGDHNVIQVQSTLKNAIQIQGNIYNDIIVFNTMNEMNSTIGRRGDIATALDDPDDNHYKWSTLTNIWRVIF